MERWAEASGNTALAGRELPPAQVIAADQRIAWLARQLKKAGLAGSMEELRARAYIDLLLGTDSRPRTGQPRTGRPRTGQPRTGQPRTGQPRTGRPRPGRPGTGRAGSRQPAGPGMPPGTGALPAGFAGRVNLTIPLATLLGLAERPGEIPGLGPIAPNPGANTWDRYQTGASADPGIQHIDVPDGCPPQGR